MLTQTYLTHICFTCKASFLMKGHGLPVRDRSSRAGQEYRIGIVLHPFSCHPRVRLPSNGKGVRDLRRSGPNDVCELPARRQEG